MVETDAVRRGHTEPVEVCGQAIAHPSTDSG